MFKLNPKDALMQSKIIRSLDEGSVLDLSRANDILLPGSAVLPKRLMIELTTACDFKCPYCYCVWHELSGIGIPLLDTTSWKRVLEKCAQQGVWDILFTGGEPLMRDDLFELIDFTREIMPKCSLTVFTNGSHMTEELLQRFKSLGVRLCTSLQGLRTYKDMTGANGDFHHTLAMTLSHSKVQE